MCVCVCVKITLFAYRYLQNKKTNVSSVAEQYTLFPLWLFNTILNNPEKEA